MGIQLASPPQESIELVTDAILTLSGSHKGAAAKLTACKDPSRLNSALPHPVYHLGVVDIQQGKHLDSADLVGWRFLILDGKKTVAAIELCVAKGRLEFGHLETGPFVEATRDALRVLEKNDDVKNGCYEFRLLRSPGVYTAAIWLKDLKGHDDIVYSLNPRPGSFGGDPTGKPTVQDPGSFMTQLVPVADVAMNFYRPGGAGSGPVGNQPPPTPQQPPASIGGLPGIPALNRMQFIKNYAAMVARTWVDDAFLQLLRMDPVTALANSGLPTTAGAEVVVVETKVTGVGKVEDALDEWTKGNQTGRYLLWLPIKPDNVNLPGGGGSAIGGGCCSCCPCCCCT